MNLFSSGCQGGILLVFLLTVVRMQAQPAGVVDAASESTLIFGPSSSTLDRTGLSGASEPVGPSTRRTGLVISEIMYHPAARADGRNLEFIELYNSEAWFTDISGFRLAGDVEYIFPAGTILPSHGYLVIAASPPDIAAVHGLQNVHGYSGSLSNSGGTVRLSNRQRAILWEVNYSDEAPWPAAADGTGHSLVLARPSLGQRDPRAWAASAQPGGSPGAEESSVPNPHAGLFINEFLALPGAGQQSFVELFNYTDAPMSLDGLAITDDPATNKLVFIPGAQILAHGYISLPAIELGFSPNPKGGVLLLRETAGGRVLDAIRYGDQATGTSIGRAPDGADDFSPLVQPTPGTANAALLRPDVVLNEIMYDPVSGDSADEFVELFNRADQPVNMGDWSLAGDINFTFHAGTFLPARGDPVVGKSVERLWSRYAWLNSANSIGNYSGSLKNGRGRVQLLKSESTGPTAKDTLHVLVDQVAYDSGGRWGRWSGGGGSSLELTDPRADSRLAPNWAESDQTASSDWVTVETTGVLDNGNGAADSLQVFLLGAGECLVDNVEVFRRGSTNLLANSKFDASIQGWVPQGNQVYSSWQSSGGVDDTPCLRLRATGRGDTGANRVRVPFSPSLPPGQTATIRAKARWLRGSQFILFRLHGNWLEATTNILTTRALGTPGLPNSRASENSPPAITEVTHTPALPTTQQSVIVSARVTDPDGLAALDLNYRIDPKANYTQVSMEPRGAGYFTAVLPAQAPNALVAYFIEATDNFVRPATNRFPNDAPQRECLVRFSEPSGKGNFGNYHFWLAQNTVTRWSKREQLSNDPLDATFVYGSSRVIYNIGAQYSGSPYHAPSYNSPTGNFCDYALVFPPDDPLLGETDVNLILPGNGCCEGSVQREATAYWMADQLGLPFNYTRPVHVYLNGQHRAPVLTLDSQQANGDFVAQWWPDANDGDLHKIQLWFEFDSRASQFQPIGAEFGRYVTTGGQKKLARYRWNWARRSDVGDINNYTNMYALHDLMLTAATGTNYARQIEAGIDTENWIRTVAIEHIVGNPDSFAYGGGQNMYIYKPEGDRWRWMIWDIDFAFSAESPGTSVFQFGGGALNKFMTHPPFRRAFYRALQDAVNGPLAPENSSPLLDARYQAFRATGLNPESTSAIKSYIASRRRYLTNQLARAASVFQITSGTDVTTTTGLAVVSGTAPFNAASIQVNGEQWPITWTTLSNWTMQVAVPPGTVRLKFEAINNQGASSSGTNNTVVVTSTANADPALGNVFINEWMSSNKRTVADPADGKYEDWIELFNAGATSVNLGGYFFSNDPANRSQWTFPPQTIIPARNFLLLWADEQPEQLNGGDLHLPFKLDSAGEFIGLFGPAGLEIDSVNYLAQDSDSSSGRYPNGASSIGRLSRATPGAANAASITVAAPVVAARSDMLAGTARLSWTGELGARYRLEFTDDLNGPVWRAVGTASSGIGQIISVAVPLDDGAVRFFRVVAE